MLKKCKCGKTYFQRSTLQNCCPSCALAKAANKEKKPTKFNFEKTDKPRKKSKKSLAREKADKWFSRYNRLLHSRQDGDFVFCICYTCGIPHHIKKMDNGHYIGRGHIVVRYELDDCRPQCTSCNVYKQGMHYEFEQHLIRDIGQDAVDKLKELAKEPIKDSVEYYDEIATHYRNMVSMLQKKMDVKVW